MACAMTSAALLLGPAGLVVSSGQQPAADSAAPLTNTDVVKLLKAGLGDAVVVAKIRDTKSVAFDLGTDGLIALKKQGVSDAVIQAMLSHGTPQAPALPATAAAPSLKLSRPPAVST